MRFQDFLFPSKGSVVGDLLRSTFIYSPIIGPLVVIAFTGFDNLSGKWLNGFVVTLVVSYFGVFFQAFFHQVVEPAVAKIRKRPMNLRGQTWWFAFGLMIMPLALYLGFQVNGVVHDWFGLRKTIVPDDYRVGILVGAAISVGFFLLEIGREIREKSRKAELRIRDMENQRLQAQLSALTAQMNPHLMFNALNTVASLVPSDPRKAEEVVVKLSQLYRGVLDSSRRIIHSLATELSICEAYLAVEQARFGDRILTRIEIDPALDPLATEVPALCIQPLIENAVKHGLSPRASGGEISVSATVHEGHINITVQDDGVGLNAGKSAKGAGIGLKNCQERLRLHYGSRSRFQVSERSKGGTTVSLTFPLNRIKEAHDDAHRG